MSPGFPYSDVSLHTDWVLQRPSVEGPHPEGGGEEGSDTVPDPPQLSSGHPLGPAPPLDAGSEDHVLSPAAQDAPGVHH